jgi:hypothetical protein
MTNRDDLVGNPNHDNSVYCLADENEIYLVYLPDGGSTSLDLSGSTGTFTVAWFNPRTGGDLIEGAVGRVDGGGPVMIGPPPMDPEKDWALVIRR